MPVLGKYDELRPEVKDWETKWAVEHGIDFMVYCWSRTFQGTKVIQSISDRPITKGLSKSKYVKKIKFAIHWINGTKGISGASGQDDLLNNLLPYWMETYFKHPSYLKIDNRPVLFIYTPENLIEDLGSVVNVQNSFEKMRAACRSAGFAGLTIVGQYRRSDRVFVQVIKEMGFD